jgi:hypothetical protein
MEHFVDDRLGRPGEPVAEASKGCQRQSMLRFKHVGEEPVYSVRLVNAAASAISSMLTRVNPFRRNST